MKSERLTLLDMPSPTVESLADHSLSDIDAQSGNVHSTSAASSNLEADRSQDVELNTQDPKISSLIVRLGSILSDVGLYRRLVGSKTSDAQRLLDSFQQILDIPGVHMSFRKRLIVATQRISAKSGLYPTCYELKDVVQDGEYPESSGGFADIYKGTFRGQVVCLKTIRLYQKTDIDYALKQMSKEALLWGQLRHPNIATIYGIFRFKNRVCMVSPWMANGDIRTYLSSNSQVPRLPLPLKPNVLIDDAGRAHLADFGISSATESNILSWTTHTRGTSRGGSVRWQAPELFTPADGDDPPNTMESDVYAWGDEIPFSDIGNNLSVMVHVTSGGRPALREPLKSFPGLSEDIWSLMERCWNEDPSQRPSSAEVLRSLSTKPVKDTRQNPDNGLSPSHFRQEMNERTNILDVESLDQILHPALSGVELSAEEQEWVAHDVMESKPVKGNEFSMGLLTQFLDEIDQVFGGRKFTSIIGDISLNKIIKSRLQEEDGWKEEDDFQRARDTKGRKILTKEEKARKDINGPQTVAEAYRTERQKSAEETISRKERVAQLADILAHKLEIFTELAAGPDDLDVSKGWRETCELEANNLKRESYGVELLHIIGSIYVAKAKQFLATKQSPLGVGGLFHSVKDKYHAFSGHVSIIQTVSAMNSANIDVQWADSEGLSAEKKKELEEKSIKKGMQAWFKQVQLEVELVLRETCDATLEDPRISKDKTQLRAVALQILGESFMAARGDDLTHDNRDSVFFSSESSTSASHVENTDRRDQIADLMRMVFSVL
ncbi:hypothetical protein DXG01_003946 [Tephrocybe rancida]|nr:hypothetical protein DXG01_003946 [Tephrocybe rancida]